MNNHTGFITPEPQPEIAQRAQASPPTSFAVTLLTSEHTLDVVQPDGRVVDEVIHLAGVAFPLQVVTLDGFDRSSVMNCIGSVRNLRRLGDKEIRGEARFTEGVERAQDARQLVAQGFIDRVGTMLWAQQIAEVGPGESVVIDHITYTARADVGLFVITKSLLKAAVLCPCVGTGKIAA